MQDEKNLKIYCKALDYVSKIYNFSTELPNEEKYNLVSQIKRAAVSIALNISEGAASSTKKEFAQFLSYAYRSTKEVITCFEIIKRLGLAERTSEEMKILEKDGQELCKMIYSFRDRLIKN